MPVRALDITTLSRWLGTATGMLRIEQELARQALSLEDVSLVVYDEARRAFRPVPRDCARTVVERGCVLQAPVQEVRTGWHRVVPSRLRTIFALERRRLRARSDLARRCYDALQRLLIAAKATPIRLDDESGRRLNLVPQDWVLGAPLPLGPDDLVLLPPSDWAHRDVEVLRAIKRACGVRLAAMCTDIIALTHPEFFRPPDVMRFRAYWSAMFGLAEVVIVNSKRVLADVEEYCRDRHPDHGRFELVPLGLRLPEPRAGGPAPLPAGLEDGRFAMFVSTVEPRKNHALLLRVWRRLLADGVPQRAGFKLVFVGREGWMVDDLMAQIRAPEFAGSLLHLTNIDDEQLSALYDAAAFCLYPSRYEGFGLPVIEAFARGKPVIASGGGSLQEVAGPHAPCLDPDDADAWATTMQAWIERPELVAARAEAIAREFTAPPWPEVALRTFEAAGLMPRARAERVLGAARS
jgi:glycosyltransferase involved in cell wall biosynthesis